MAKIEKSVSGSFNRVSVDLYMTNREFDMLEGFRSRTEEWMRENPQCEFTDESEFSLDDAIIYMVCEVLAGRGKYINLHHAFKD